ncbi:MAG: metal-sensing transcriptional repressor [Sedimentibacter sp.]|uniref:metal-sensing transcriptional repressor n=1 Tax=Sedimentibacter sp. TaxID=1960295 RepID=UPI003158A7CF
MKKDKENAVTSLKTVKGQIEGIIKMLEEDRYCVDISNQIFAAQSLLKKSNILILKQHIHHCVKEAIKEDKGDEKINEIIVVLEKIIQK